MIPKIIHYCWFGKNPKPKIVRKCINSWKKYCPDYEIIEWNEDNYDLASAPLFVRRAFEEKKWAFVTDYVRLIIVYEYGGVYLDTDVELLKNIDFLIRAESFFGFEDGKHIATGLGFGAEKGFPLLLELLDSYNNINEQELNYNITCPVLNTEVFLKHGLKQDNSYQILDSNIYILPSYVLCPIDYSTGKLRRKEETVSIHWFSASWQTEEQKQQHKENARVKRKTERKDYWLHIPNRIAMKILGEQRYSAIKMRIKREQ